MKRENRVIEENRKKKHKLEWHLNPSAAAAAPPFKKGVKGEGPQVQGDVRHCERSAAISKKRNTSRNFYFILWNNGPLPS